MTGDVLEKLKDAVIGCLDVGRDQGWVVVDQRNENWAFGNTAEGFRDSLGPYLADRRLCLVGLEAPGFLPLAQNYTGLFGARVGETDFGQSRPWSISAGRNATWSALPLLPKLLGDLRASSPTDVEGHVDFARAVDGKTRLILFEAFVTTAPPGQVVPPVPEPVKGQCCHVWDAAIAVIGLRLQVANGQIVSAIRGDVALSLFGAALLATGWSSDPSLASRAAHVVRAFKPQMLSHP